MAAKGPARASLRYAKAPLSPRYQWELHQLLGHCFNEASSDIPVDLFFEEDLTQSDLESFVGI